MFCSAKILFRFFDNELCKYNRNYKFLNDIKTYMWASENLTQFK